MAEPARVHINVAGRVQGVGFRYSAYHEAQRLGLHGWVRNRADGNVESEAEGPVPAVDAYVAWCRQGPSFARVTHVDVQRCPAGGGERDFRIRY